MITIYGRRTSSNVMLPLWAVDELGLAYEQIDLGGPFGGNDTPEYLAKNPNGLIPTLEDDGFVLWESNAITRYLCSRYGSGELCPIDLRDRALAEQWMDWKLSTVVPMMTPIFWGLVRTPEAERDTASIERAIRRGAEIWGLLDAHLAQQPYVAGSTFTMGDIPLGPQVHRWYNLVEDRPELPHLEAWYRRLQERLAFRKHCMIPIV
jgi:glutathione S-transferase